MIQARAILWERPIWPDKRDCPFCGCPEANRAKGIGQQGTGREKRQRWACAGCGERFTVAPLGWVVTYSGSGTSIFERG